MGRKGESIFKRKDGRYEARYIKYYDTTGKAKYGYVYGKTYQEAKRKRNKAITNIKFELKPTNITTTFNQAIDKWLIFKKARIKNSTYALYIQLIDKHIKPKLGKYKLENINQEILEHYVGELLNNGRLDKNGGLSNKTVIDITTIIKQILKYNNIFIKNITLKNNHPNIQIFNKNEVEIITNNTIDSENRLLFGIFLCLYTGIRIGEICALKCEDINIENSFLSIHSTVIRIKNLETNDNQKTKVIISTPKSTKSIRIIPLPEKITQKIKPFLNTAKENYFLTNTKSYIEPRNYYNTYKKCLKDWKIPHRKFHYLRHTFATKCMESGFDIKALSEILGHTNINITLNLYVHPTLEQKKKYMNSLL